MISSCPRAALLGIVLLLMGIGLGVVLTAALAWCWPGDPCE